MLQLRPDGGRVLSLLEKAEGSDHKDEDTPPSDDNPMSHTCSP